MASYRLSKTSSRPKPIFYNSKGYPVEPHYYPHGAQYRPGGYRKRSTFGGYLEVPMLGKMGFNYAGGRKTRVPPPPVRLPLHLFDLLDQAARLSLLQPLLVHLLYVLNRSLRRHLWDNFVSRIRKLLLR